MVHGTPDWQDLHPKGQTYAMNDMAELAARLDSPVKWDRRGEVVWFNTFESGMKAARFGGVGLNLAHYLTTEYPFHGSNALRLEAGNADGNFTYYSYFFPLPSSMVWGYQGWFSFDDVTFQVSFSWTYGTETFYYEAGFRYDYVAEEIQIPTEDAGWVTLETGKDLYSELWMYHIFKLVANWDTGKYVRLIVDDSTYILSEYNLPITMVGGTPYLRMSGHLYNTDGNTAHLNVDSLIWTINEPE